MSVINDNLASLDSTRRCQLMSNTMFAVEVATCIAVASKCYSHKEPSYHNSICILTAPFRFLHYEGFCHFRQELDIVPYVGCVHYQLPFLDLGKLRIPNRLLAWLTNIRYSIMLPLSLLKVSLCLS